MERRSSPDMSKDPIFDGNDIFYYMSCSEIKNIKDRIIREKFSKKLKDLKFKLNDIKLDNDYGEMDSGFNYQIGGYILYKNEKIEVNMTYTYDNNYEKELKEIYRKYGNKYIECYNIMNDYIEIDINQNLLTSLK